MKTVLGVGMAVGVESGWVVAPEAGPQAARLVMIRTARNNRITMNPSKETRAGKAPCLLEHVFYLNRKSELGMEGIGIAWEYRYALDG